MTEIAFMLAMWLVSQHDVDALQLTASITDDAAVENIAAARVAGAAYKIDPDLLLAIAYRESRYQPSSIGPVVRGKRACGVMQPIMRDDCRPSSLLDGYLEGANHLRGWIRATRSQRDSLIGYAGGFAMIKLCKEGPLERVRAGRVVDLCSTPELRRAAWIRRMRTRATSGS